MELRVHAGMKCKSCVFWICMEYIRRLCAFGNMQCAVTQVRKESADETHVEPTKRFVCS